MKHLKKYFKIVVSTSVIFSLLFSTIFANSNALTFGQGSKYSANSGEEETKNSLLNDFLKTLPKLKFSDNDKVRVIIEVDGNKSEVKKKVEKIDGVKIIYDYKELINGFSIEITKDKLAELSVIEGIKNLDYSDKLIPAMVNAKKLTKVLEAKQKYSPKGNLDGRGMVIASLDSGVDINSKDLKLDSGDKDGIDKDVYNSLKIKDTIFKTEDGKPNYKIPYAFNFFRGDTTLIDEVPKPHGMHIAGILTGNSGEKDGFKGIAPNAQLLVYKVITYDRKIDTRPDLVEYVGEDAAFFAMEDAIARGADVISLSIGNQGSGASNDIWNSVVKKAHEKGVVVVAAMGNWASSNSESSFDIYADEGISLKDNSSTVSVAANKDTIGVGSTYNTILQLPSVKIGDLEEIPYKDISKFNNTTLPSEAISYPLIYVDRGMEGFNVSSDFDKIKNKIVIARRGGEAVKDKAVRFLKNGAKGFILINDVTDFSRGNNDTHPVIGFEHLTIPEGWAIGISGNSGKKIIEYIKNKNEEIKVVFDKTEKNIQLKQETGISGFSSWGPNYDLEIKPDVVAPGEDIYSLGNHNTYTIMSGTSMASPHVAGVSTLLLQSLKESKNAEKLNINKNDFVKILLMNTSTVLKDSERKAVNEDSFEYSPRRQGAGMIDLEAALSSDVIVRYKDKGAISLGEMKGDTKKFTLKLDNFGNERRSFNIRSSEVLHEVSISRIRNNEENKYETKTLHLEPLKGASLEKQSEVSIPASSSVELNFTLNVASANEEFVEGFIYFDSKDDAQANLSIPYMAFKGDWNKEKIVDEPVWEENSKTKLTSLFKVIPGHHGHNEYLEIGREGNHLKGKEKEELKINPLFFALNNSKRNAETVVAEIVPRIIFLRNVDTYEISIVDEKDDNKTPITIINTAHYPKKYIHNIFKEGGNETYEMPDDFNKWNGRAYDPKTGDYIRVKEGQYYFRIKSKLNKNDEKYQVTYIPVKVDITDPTLNVEYDKSNSRVKINTSDNFGIWRVSASLDGAEREVLKVAENEYVIENVNVSSLTESELVVEAMDYAGNPADKFVKKLNETEPNLIIENIKKLVDNKAKEVRLKYKDSVSDIVIKNSKEEVIEINNDKDEKIISFELSKLEKDRTFIVEFTNNGLKVVENFVILSNPPKEKEEEKDDVFYPQGEFNPENISIYPGLFFPYDKIDKEIDGNEISYETDKNGNPINMQLKFYIELDEGFRAEVTNINSHYNKVNGIEVHKEMGKVEIDGEFNGDKEIAVFNGTNIINVKVYKGDELIYNRGFMVFIDSVRPAVKIKNTNIIPNPDYGDDEENAGNIYVSGDNVTLFGSVEEDLDGVKVSINDNVIENVNLPGEYGKASKDFSYKFKVENGDKVKVEVKDYSNNSRKMVYTVIKDSEAPNIEISPSESSKINKDTLLKIQFSDNMEEDNDYSDNLLEKKVYVNGKEYKDDELSNYMLSGEEKFYILAVAKDRAGNETKKEIKVNIDSTLKENLTLKKDEFSIKDIDDLSKIIELDNGSKGEILNTIVDEDANLATLEVKIKDDYGFEKVYTLMLKLTDTDYIKDDKLSIPLKQKSFIQGDNIKVSDLFDIPEDIGLIVNQKIDVSTPGKKIFKVKLFKNNTFNTLEYEIFVEAQKFHLIYKSDNENILDDKVYEKGTKVKLDKVPTKEGYYFDGWYKDENFAYRLTEIELVENTTVYAKWIKKIQLIPEYINIGIGDSKTEDSKTGNPKVEESKVEDLKTESPKVEEIKSENPKTKYQKTEVSKQKNSGYNKLQANNNIKKDSKNQESQVKDKDNELDNLKKELEKEITLLENIKKEDIYKKANKEKQEEVNKSLKEAKDVLQNVSATKEDILTAISKLQVAKNNLTKIDSNQNTKSKEKTEKTPAKIPAKTQGIKNIYVYSAVLVGIIATSLLIILGKKKNRD